MTDKLLQLPTHLRKPGAGRHLAYALSAMSIICFRQYTLKPAVCYIAEAIATYITGAYRTYHVMQCG